MINNKTNIIGLEKPVLFSVLVLWFLGILSLFIGSYYLRSEITSLSWSIGSSQAGIIIALLFFICIFISLVSWTALTFQIRAEDFAAQFDEEIYQEKLKTMHADKLASLGRMSAGVAHEINNPLAIICGKIQTLSKQTLDEKVQNDMATILKQSERIAKIVKALSGSSLDTSFETYGLVSLESLVKDCYDLLRNQLEIKEIRTTITTRLENTNVICKSTEVSQILMNLFSNSVDAVENLKEKWIHIDIENTEDHLSLKFIDSGGPLSKDLAYKIMDPFFTTKDIGKGTGLGLSVSRSQAISNKGSLEYDSKAITTTFVLKLPKA